MRLAFNSAVMTTVIVGAASCARPHVQQPAQPPSVGVVVTAYCQGTRTATGVRVAPGIAAADPRVFPLGSSVRVSGLHGRYDGVYQVLDTGSRVRGRHLDLYLPNCKEARLFGRRSALASILRRGNLEP
jgi:3D (Asp-Asp-Asp) domain-containing protein